MKKISEKRGRESKWKKKRERESWVKAIAEEEGEGEKMGK